MIGDGGLSGVRRRLQSLVLFGKHKGFERDLVVVGRFEGNIFKVYDSWLFAKKKHFGSHDFFDIILESLIIEENPIKHLLSSFARKLYLNRLKKILKNLHCLMFEFRIHKNIK